MKKRVGLIFFLVFFTAFSAANVYASPLDEKLPGSHFRASIQSPDLFDRIADATNSIRDLSAQVDIQVRLSQMGMTFNVSGEFFYKQPDKVTLKLKNVPEFLFNRQSDSFKTTNILTRLRYEIKTQYDARIVNEITFQGENCYVVQLIPKKDEGVSRILVWVNATHYTMPKVIIHYQDGASLSQEKTYTKADDVYVVQKLDSEYTSADSKAKILATFGSYKINQGVADSVFEHPTARTFITAF